MLVGLMKLHLRIPYAKTLKERRRIIRSFVEKAKNKHNVSIVELKKEVLVNEAQVGIAFISDSENAIKALFDDIEKIALSNGETEIVKDEREIFEFSR